MGQSVVCVWVCVGVCAFLCGYVCIRVWVCVGVCAFLCGYVCIRVWVWFLGVVWKSKSERPGIALDISEDWCTYKSCSERVSCLHLVFFWSVHFLISITIM